MQWGMVVLIALGAFTIPLTAARAMPPAPPGLVCPGSSYWNGFGCTSGRVYERRFVDVVAGKSTKVEILALYGPPAFVYGDDGSRQLLSYYEWHMRPPYPTWLRRSLGFNGMVVFQIDERGIFVGHYLETQPSP
jgi:hypothetical protein